MSKRKRQVTFTDTQADALINILENTPADTRKSILESVLVNTLESILQSVPEEQKNNTEIIFKYLEVSS